VKETDRLAALKWELTKLGAEIEIEGDDLRIAPPAGGVPVDEAKGEPVSWDNPVEIDTYDDHRMAMSFAVAGLRCPGVWIRDPRCVEKTFPEFWRYLDRLGPRQEGSR
jgi:3-phosphoshikimate 1-carboxyvinyltransferase